MFRGEFKERCWCSYRERCWCSYEEPWGRPTGGCRWNCIICLLSDTNHEEWICLSVSRKKIVFLESVSPTKFERVMQEMEIHRRSSAVLLFFRSLVVPRPRSRRKVWRFFSHSDKNLLRRNYSHRSPIMGNVCCPENRGRYEPENDFSRRIVYDAGPPYQQTYSRTVPAPSYSNAPGGAYIYPYQHQQRCQQQQPYYGSSTSYTQQPYASAPPPLGPAPPESASLRFRHSPDGWHFERLGNFRLGAQAPLIGRKYRVLPTKGGADLVEVTNYDIVRARILVDKARAPRRSPNTQQEIKVPTKNIFPDGESSLVLRLRNLRRRPDLEGAVVLAIEAVVSCVVRNVANCQQQGDTSSGGLHTGQTYSLAADTLVLELGERAEAQSEERHVGDKKQMPPTAKTADSVFRNVEECLGRWRPEERQDPGRKDDMEKAMIQLDNLEGLSSEQRTKRKELLLRIDTLASGEAGGQNEKLDVERDVGAQEGGG